MKTMKQDDVFNAILMMLCANTALLKVMREYLTKYVAQHEKRSVDEVVEEMEALYKKHFAKTKNYIEDPKSWISI